jgi:hypothetical protein
MGDTDAAKAGLAALCHIRIKTAMASGRRNLKRLGLPIEALARHLDGCLLLGQLLVFLAAEWQDARIRNRLPPVGVPGGEIALEDA